MSVHKDLAYARAPSVVPLLAHSYGERVHLVHDPVLLAKLARFCSAQCRLPELAELLRGLYVDLLQCVLTSAWPRETVAAPTRMHKDDANRGIWHGEVVGRGPLCIVAGLARAGLVPAQACAEFLWTLFGEDAARQDLLVAARRTDPATKAVEAEVQMSKVGGDANGCWLLVPDPMGATGQSMAAAVAAYRALPKGPPARIFALHLIVTPEYLAHMQATQPEVEVWALRLDRGASSAATLATPPGTDWHNERGLNEHAYILPGAGGVGEILNHAAF